MKYLLNESNCDIMLRAMAGIIINNVIELYNK